MQKSPIRESKQVTKVIQAYTIGYWMDKEGKCFSTTGNQLKPWSDKRGYLQYSAHLFGKKFALLGHKLQAYQKFGVDCFREGIQIRHLNGNASDNSWENIAIGTASDNQLDIPKEKRIEKAIKASKAKSQLTIEQNESLYWDLVNGLHPRDLSKKYNIPVSTIDSMRWESVSFKIFCEENNVVPKKVEWKICKQTSKDKNAIFQMLYDGCTYNYIQQFFEVSKSTLSNMKNKSQEYKDFCNKKDTK